MVGGAAADSWNQAGDNPGRCKMRRSRLWFGTLCALAAVAGCGALFDLFTPDTIIFTFDHSDVVLDFDVSVTVQ